MTKDFLFRGELAELDPDVAELVRHETARQSRHLIMIPSESTVPEAVREAIGSAFHNIYAEGYPLESTRAMTEGEILNYSAQLSAYRRNADNRYYKGTEFANLIEALARRRTAEVFATAEYGPDQLYINAQPLSGAPANNAVYTALLAPGDTVMSMNLMVGGHLSHGAPVNRSGKWFNIVSYSINPKTEALDYEEMLRLAIEHKPKIIIGGYSSYPLLPDWDKYREIADAAGAYLMADVAHVAGLIIAGVYPNPVGIADIVTLTTHKTLNGPRGAVIITHRSDLYEKLDRGVFPGEQGGPHMNSIAGLAVAMRLARTEQFKKLQQQTVINAKRLAQRLQERGLRLPHGGTESHLLLIDCATIKGTDGTSLSGDMAARILDLAGIVCNRQTIPGDTSALRPSGIRLGTPWITQRGCGDTEIDKLANIIADVLQACEPYSLTGKTRPPARAKVNFDTLQNARVATRELVDSIGIDTDVKADGYPFFYYIDDIKDKEGWYALSIRGERARDFLHFSLSSDVYALNPGEKQATNILEEDGSLMSTGLLEMINNREYILRVQNAGRVTAWLRGLSDGFVLFDRKNVSGKIPGPVIVDVLKQINKPEINEQEGYTSKAYFIGINGEKYKSKSHQTLPEFRFEPPQQETLLRTPLYPLHLELGAKMTSFAGYEMPLWYDSVAKEHTAVREHAGIFDISHMGIFGLRGEGAQIFLNCALTNDIYKLKTGFSLYAFMLDIHGKPLDDLMVYRADENEYIMVVNAANNNKDWEWLNAVKGGRGMIARGDTTRQIEGSNRFELIDLRATSSEKNQLALLALQGPASRDILLSLLANQPDKATIQKLPWAGIARAKLKDYDVLISRTGYTGERIAYEIFIHPDAANSLMKDLIAAGAIPCGLAARDSLRIEAGLPLYGNDLGGRLGLNPADAGMGLYVKLSKPFFIGKAAFVEYEKERNKQISRFQIANSKARPAHPGNKIVDSEGNIIGEVTSGTIKRNGYQIGMAHLQNPYRKVGTQLKVLTESKRSDSPIAQPIVIISRFPKRK